MQLWLTRGLYRAPHALRRRGYQIGDGGDRLRRSRGLASRLPHRASTSAVPTTDAIGAFGNGRAASGRADAEADGDRQLGMTLDARDGSADHAASVAGAPVMPVTET